MHRRQFVTPSERRYRSSKRPTQCGSNDPVSPMSEPHRDIDITATEVDGRIILAPEGGDSGEWITALWAIPEAYWR